jgi:hypothetical protein
LTEEKEVSSIKRDYKSTTLKWRHTKRILKIEQKIKNRINQNEIQKFCLEKLSLNGCIIEKK